MANPIFKMVIVGKDGVGKTALLDAFRGNPFQPTKPSDSAQEVTLKIDLQGSNSHVELWCFDLPGRASFMGLNRMYLRDAHIALVVYDVTNQDSLQVASEWIEELKNTAPSELLICMCGNKVDVPQRAISLTQG